MLFFVCFWLRLAGLQAGAAEGDDIAEPFAVRAEKAFLEARRRSEEAPADATAAWEFGRAAYDWAEFAKTSEEREAIARQGIAACRKAIALAPDSAAGHYYLALNLGQLARTRLLGALRLVAEMEEALLRAARLDSRFDYAGPHRSLGILYLEAPGWPASIGSRSRARKHLEKAVELSPEYPENLLALAEAHAKWGDRKRAESVLKRLAPVMEEARDVFTGPRWELAWKDWIERWEKLKREGG